jgi:hypothetical protein
MSENSTWETPFTTAAHSSVGIIVEAEGDSTAIVVVAPDGIDRYPKYLVRFTSVYAFTCEEEADSPNDFGQTDSEQGHYAYKWLSSPYVQSYSRLYPDIPFRGGSDKLTHYVFLGGDNVISVVSADIPTIETIDSPTTMQVTHAV